MRYDSDRPDAQLRLKTFAKQIALGTGVGLRYDLDFLVFRLDCGCLLHDPYETGSRDTIMWGGILETIRYTFAIGYPF